MHRSAFTSKLNLKFFFDSANLKTSPSVYIITVFYDRLEKSFCKICDILKIKSFLTNGIKKKGRGV